MKQHGGRKGLRTSRVPDSKKEHQRILSICVRRVKKGQNPYAHCAEREASENSTSCNPGPPGRRPRKARGAIFRNVIAKIVQNEKRVEFGRVAEAECATQMHACAVARRFGFDEAFDRA